MRARTHAFLQMLSRTTGQNKTVLPFVSDDDDDGPGDPDFLSASESFSEKVMTTSCTFIISAESCHIATWLCGARECSMISTIVRPLSAPTSAPPRTTKHHFGEIVADLALTCGSEPAVDAVCIAVVGSARSGHVFDAGPDRVDRSSDVCNVGDT